MRGTNKCDTATFTTTCRARTVLADGGNNWNATRRGSSNIQGCVSAQGPIVSHMSTTTCPSSFRSRAARVLPGELDLPSPRGKHMVQRCRQRRHRQKVYNTPTHTQLGLGSVLFGAPAVLKGCGVRGVIRRCKVESRDYLDCGEWGFIPTTDKHGQVMRQCDATACY